jgi:ribosomal protein S18 acetylase RimI-like enzyme
MIQLKELSGKEEMLSKLEIMKELYPNLTLEKYDLMLTDMIPNNQYGQLAAFEDGECLAICGFWLGTKLWCGKYLELDNVVVAAKARSKGIGKLLTDYLENKAIELKCTIMVLDAYTNNFGAHRFYYNQGFGPKGFHFIKIKNEQGLT